MDGGSGEPVAWRSSIPGLSQREGAPVSLGLAGHRADASSLGEEGGRCDGGDPSIGLSGDGRSGGRRLRRAVPWRAIGLAVVALVAILGVARAAGIDAGGLPGVADGTVGSGWETVGALDGSAVGEDGRSALGAGDGPTLVPGPEGPASLGSPTPAPAPVGNLLGGESPDWWTILAELDARRARALTDVDPALLSTYAHPGSAAWTGDAALLADLSARDLSPLGIASRVLAVEGVDHDGAQARLQVVDERTGYSMVDSDGAVVQQVAPTGPRRWTVWLSRLAPTATDAESVDPGEAPESSAVPERGAEPNLSSGRDPGWRVAAVEPVESGESSDIEGGDEASTGAGDATVGGAPGSSAR